MSDMDWTFRKIYKQIMDGSSDEGQDVRPKWEDGTPAHTMRTTAVVNRYDLAKEFPMLTLRKINFEAAVDEILWIWQKKSNRIADLKSHIWDAWADAEGTIGKAYGYQLGVKHQYSDGEFDQVDRILHDLRHNPQSRRMVTSLFNHQDLHEMALYPCAWSMTFMVENGRLHAILNQRSQDVLAANAWNVCQYAVLVHLFAQVSNLQPGILTHVIADAHIYDRHIPIMEQLVGRTEEYPAPRLWLNPEIKDFYQFTLDDIKLLDYQHGPGIGKIPIAV